MLPITLRLISIDKGYRNSISTKIMVYIIDPPIDSHDLPIYVPKQFPVISRISSLQNSKGSANNFNQIRDIEGLIMGTKFNW